jgi:hypothetical protein
MAEREQSLQPCRRLERRRDPPDRGHPGHPTLSRASRPSLRHLHFLHLNHGRSCSPLCFCAVSEPLYSIHSPATRPPSAPLSAPAHAPPGPSARHVRALVLTRLAQAVRVRVPVHGHRRTRSCRPSLTASPPSPCCRRPTLSACSRSVLT